MRTLLRPAMSLLLVATMVSLTFAMPPSPPPPTPTADPGACNLGNDKVKGKVQTLRGDAAKLRIKQLEGKKKGLKRALKDFEKLGKSPVWEDSAVFTVEPEPGPQARNFPPSFGGNSFAPQDTQAYSDGAGSEMVMITQSGPEQYWSGIIYVYDATTGLDSTYTAVLTGLVMTELDSLDVVDELYYPPDGSNPIREEPPTPVEWWGGDGGGGGREPIDSPFYTLQVVKHDTKGPAADKSIKVGFAGMTAPSARGIFGWFKRYFRCVRRCTALTTLTCFNVFATPRPGMPYPNYQGFFVCLSFGALASSIVCAFNTRACGG